MQLLQSEYSFFPEPDKYKTRFPDLTSQTIQAVALIYRNLARFAAEGLLGESSPGVRLDDILVQVWRRSCSGEHCQEAVVWQVFRCLLGRRLVSSLAQLEIFECVLGESLNQASAPPRLGDYDYGSRPGLARRRRLQARVPGASEVLAERALSLNDYLGTLAEQHKLPLAVTAEQDAEELCRRALELAQAQDDRPESCLRLAACLYYQMHDRKFQLILDLFC
ncbi:hypothetical protein DYH09_17205 [bacterium CPR1]|nr:hypothetical protein [bacterium CPR1]